MACAAILFALNAYTCRELFHAGFIHTMGSVEGAYIAMGRYAMRNWNDLTWFPLWFSGMPWTNVYQPGFPLTIAVFARAFGASPVIVYHALTAVAYCAGPASLFVLCYGFTHSRAYAMAVGLVYSAFSPSVILPVLRHDIGGLFRPRRYQATVHYGEGPHIAVLALLPIAIICLDRAVTGRRPAYSVLSALVIAAILFTNWPGTMGLLLALAAYVLAKIASRSTINWLVLAGVPGAAYALAYPWVPPSTIRTVITASQYANGAFPFSWRHVAFAVVFSMALLGAIWLLRRSEASFFALFLAFFTVLTAIIPVTSALTGFALLPQPHRFALEMEIPLIALACYLLRGVTRPWMFAALVLLSGVQIWRFRQYAISSLEPIDIAATSEYKVADWFDRHMPGERVFVPGSDAIWMNVFTDTPQMGGCCDQGVSNFQSRIALYTIYTGQNAGARDAEISVLWLKAFGAHAVAVSGPRSTEPFKPFANPHKFDGVLKELWRDGDDAIYEVPHRSASLAHIVDRGDIVTSAPVHGLDAGPLLPYIKALDDPRLPLAQFEWTSRHSARIIAPIEPGQLVSVQISYDPGWRARFDGKPRRVRSDSLGLIVIEPGCTGRCTINLTYHARRGW